jgi:hypothetical protein
MPVFQPMPLGRKLLPFDGPAYLFELKYDGFRAIAVVEYGRCTLYSRNGHSFASFRDLATRIGMLSCRAVWSWMERSSAWTNTVIASSVNCYSGAANRAS